MSEGYKPPLTSPAEKLRSLGFVVEEPKHFPEFHGPLALAQFGKLRSEAVRSFKRAVQACLGFIEGPIVRDEFGNDHTKRRQHRKDLDDRVYDFYEKNKLRLNNLSNVYYALGLVSKQLDAQDIHTERAEEVRDLYREIPISRLKEYGTLSDQEKSDVVTTVDNICYRFLTLVTQ